MTTQQINLESIIQSTQSNNVDVPFIFNSRSIPGTDCVVSSQLPKFVVDDHPRFVKFMEAYYTFMEKVGGVNFNIKRIKNYQDIDTTTQYFTEQFFREYLTDIPRNLLVDKAILLKHIKQFYRSKGTEESYKFLFRILFNTDVELYYPKVDILKLSDGKWIENKTIKVTGNIDLNKFLSKRIVGNTTKTIAFVESITKTLENLVEVYELVLNSSSITGQFQVGESISSIEDPTISAKIKSIPDHTGYYLNEDGQLSTGKYIHDGEYYQQFSYVIITDLSKVEYEDSVKRLIHPLGFKGFSQLRIQNKLQKKTTAKQEHTLKITSKVSHQKKAYTEVNLQHSTKHINNIGSTYNSILRDKFNYKPFTKYNANLEFMDSNNQNYFGEDILNARALTPVSAFSEIKPKDLELNRFQKTNIGIDSVVITYNSGDSDVFCIDSGECFFDFGAIVHP